MLSTVTLCWAFVVLVCVGARQRIPLSALARNPQKGLRARSPTRSEVGEGRKVQEKRRRQSAEGSRRDQSIEQVSQGDEIRAEKREELKSERRLLRSVDRGQWKVVFMCDLYCCLVLLEFFTSVLTDGFSLESE